MFDWENEILARQGKDEIHAGGFVRCAVYAHPGTRGRYRGVCRDDILTAFGLESDIPAFAEEVGADGIGGGEVQISLSHGAMRFRFPINGKRLCL